MNRPALIVAAVRLVARAIVTAVGEYVRRKLPGGDDKLARCRAIPPGSSLAEIEAVLGQAFARRMSETVEGAVWLDFSTPPSVAGRIRAVVHEPTGKVMALRCSPDEPDTWTAPEQGGR